jgi:uncharacterized membrane protein YkoI
MQTRDLIIFGVISLTALAASPAFAGANGAQDRQKGDTPLLSQAKIGMKQARVIALKAHPGRITDEELEREKGGSGLRYSFDIQKGKVTQEVGVDAKTGKVLENAPEGLNAD